MATTTYPTQFGIPSEFMKYLQDVLRVALKMDVANVRIATDKTTEQSPHNAEERTLELILNDPVPVNPKAGAGRHGFPLARQLVVKIRTRGGSDMAGEDQIALLDHWNFQDEVLNVLLVRPNVVNETDEDVPVEGTRFLSPITYLGNGGTTIRVENSGSMYESKLIFQLVYAPKVVR